MSAWGKPVTGFHMFMQEHFIFKDHINARREIYLLVDMCHAILFYSVFPVEDIYWGLGMVCLHGERFREVIWVNISEIGNKFGFEILPNFPFVINELAPPRSSLDAGRSC